MSYAAKSALSRRSRLAVVALVTTAMLGAGLTLALSSNSAQAAPLAGIVNQTYCYGLDEGTGDPTADQQFLHEVRLGAGGSGTVKSNVPVLSDPAGNIENIALRNDTSELYAYDPAAGQMFLVNGDTGAQSAPPAPFNLSGLGDVDAMFWQNDTDGDPANDVLWTIVDIDNDPGPAVNTGPDQLRGVAVDGTVFGPVSLTLPANTTVEGATWVPDTGEYLITYVDTASGSVSTLASLGNAGLPSGTPTAIGTTVGDVEGLGTDGGSQVFATTGEDGADANGFYHFDETVPATARLLDMSTGAPTGGDADFESIDCAYPAIAMTKSVQSVTPLANGNYAVVFSFDVTNTGKIFLDSVGINDPMTNYTVVDGPTPVGAGGASDCSNAAAFGTAELNIDETCNALWEYEVSNAPGDYLNTATATGTPPNGLTEPVQAPASTTATLPPANPAIGLTKDLVSVVEAGQGSHDVTYSFLIENLGDVELTAVSLADDFAATFPGLTVTGPVPDASGDCSSTVVPTGTQALAVGATCTAVWTVNVTGLVPNTVYDNTATVTGTSPAGVEVEDISDDIVEGAPNDPDPDGDGNANEDGENDPTPLELDENPVIGLTKDLVSVVEGAPGTHDVTYSFLIENLGDVDLTAVSLADDFAATFPGLTVTGPVPDASGDCSSTVVPTGTQALAVGATCTAVWTVNVTGLVPDTVYNNTATVTGTSPAGTEVEDISDDIVEGAPNDPDPDGDGNPNEDGENDPTPLVIDPSSISDFVFEDTNADGVQDPGEPGVPGVTVNLLDGAGTFITSVVTGAAGDYIFPDLTPGSYIVEFVAPAGKTFTAANVGADTDDSDADPATGQTAVITLPAGTDDITVDAGILPMLVLGDFVFEDTNADGVQDPGEPGIPGVTVNLLDGAGTFITSVVTGAAGDYVFSNLAPGSYIVEFVAPAGKTFTVVNVGPDTDDSDADPATGQTAVITLTADDLTVDAGILPMLVLGDFVFEDTDGDGVQGAGEPGIAGVTVNLLDGAGALLDTTVTGAAGDYLFSNLAPGSYIVEFVAPTGSTFTVVNVGADTDDSDADPATGQTAVITLTADDLTVDAGILPPEVLIGNFVWRDENRNGIQDPGEAGIPGVTVTVYPTDAAGAALPGSTPVQVLTDAAGEWTVPVAPGNYRIQVALPTGIGAEGFTVQDVGADTTDSDVSPNAADLGFTGVYTIAPGVDDLTIDAGVVFPIALAELGDYVWEDVNSNGVQDAGEPGIAGVTVDAIAADGSTAGTDTTDAAGEYLITGLAPGVYTVQFTAPGGIYTTQDAGTDDAIDSDPNAAGVTAPVTLAAGDSNRTLDAGIVFPPDPGSISNFVFEDTNENGIQDLLEPGVPGVIVQVFDGATLVGQDQTDVDGEYFVGDLPSSDYTVQFTLPGGRQFTVANAGTDDTEDSDADVVTGITPVIPLAPGEDNLDVDAGVLPLPVALLGSISNFVFEDTNENGIQDAGEPGIGGVTATVFNSLGSIAGVDITDAAGEYFVGGLATDDYIVEFTLPTGRTFTAQDAGGDDTADSDPDPATARTAPIPLAPGENNVDVDAGVLPVTGPGIGSIANFVFVDTNENGVQDPGEPGIAGVVVNVSDANGQFVGTDTTDDAGEYLIGGLPAGGYTVEFTLPGGLSFTAQDAGGDDTADSDPDPGTGITPLITLAAGEDNVDVDAGVLPVDQGQTGSISNFVFADGNINGIQDPNEDGVQGITVNVYNSSGLLVGSDISDGAGDYLIDNLPAGDYTVEFVLPGALQLTAADQGGDDTLDSDADPATGLTQVITLGAGQQIVDVDAGIDFGETPEIGLAKRVTDGPSATAGGYLVQYTFVIENLGNVSLSGITLADDFAATFAGVNVVSGPTPNGGTCSAEVAAAPGHTLAVGASCIAVWDVVLDTLVPGTVYNNTATVTGTSPLGEQATDISDDGVEPDTDGDNVANEAGENDPTPVSISSDPAIGLAKRVSAGPTPQGSNYVVQYTFVIENLTSETLTNVTLADDFAATFAGANVVSGPTPNGGTCSAAVAGAGATLAGNASCVAVWDVVVSGLTPGVTYNNTATVSGTSPFGVVVTDISDDGVNPDPDGDGNADEPGENDPTPLVITSDPSIGLAKRVSSGPTAQGDNYLIQYTFNIENLTPETLTNVTLADNFAATFAGANVVSGPTPNGGTCSAAVAGAGATLAGNASCVAVWDVVVSGLTPGVTYNNTATVSGTSPFGVVVTDISDDGVNPDPDGDGNANEPGENDPTPVRISPPPSGCVANDGTVLRTPCPVAFYPGPFSVAPASAAAPGPAPLADDLAFTGGNAGALAALALSMIAVGGATLIAVRRRSDED